LAARSGSRCLLPICCPLKPLLTNRATTWARRARLGSRGLQSPQRTRTIDPLLVMNVREGIELRAPASRYAFEVIVRIPRIARTCMAAGPPSDAMGLGD
jgi:hypothetical protein